MHWNSHLAADAAAARCATHVAHAVKPNIFVATAKWLFVFWSVSNHTTPKKIMYDLHREIKKYVQETRTFVYPLSAQCFLY